MLLLKAGVGTFLFILILWWTQSQHPRTAGMMLTFPALNGIGLLAGDGPSLQPMAQAMIPMIAVNGILCVGYIVVHRLLCRFGRTADSRLAAIGLVSTCLFLWFLAAAFAAPHLQSWLTLSHGCAAFVLGYLLCAISCTGLMWYPARYTDKHKSNLWDVLQANQERIGVLFGLIVLVQLFVRLGEQTWAGRFSAFPLLPLYTLTLVHAGETSTPGHASVLDQLGSTVLIGPVIAMLFVWGYGSYLHALRYATEGLTYMVGGVLGLLLGWSLCGLLIWSIVCLAAVIERRKSVSTCTVR